MKITVDGQSYKVGQLGPDFIILNEEPIPCQPTIAKMWLSIDGAEETWQIYLPEGLSEAWTEVRICEGSSISEEKVAIAV